MSRTTHIGFVLRQLLQAARRLHADALALTERPHAGDVEYRQHQQRLRELSGYQTQLRTASQALRSMQHAQDFRAARIAGMPRDRRWRERQSVEGHRAELDKAMAVARELAALLYDTHVRLNKATAGDCAKYVADFGSEWAQFIDRCKQATELIESVQQGPTLKGTQRELSVGDVAGQLALLIVLIAWLSDRLRQR